jgi:hypothetical protein
MSLFLRDIDHLALTNPIQWILKNQEDGGTAIQSGGHWAALECHTSTTAHSYRFIPAEAGSGWYLYVAATQASIASDLEAQYLP